MSEPLLDVADDRLPASEALLDALTAVTRYDLALGLIPLALVAAVVFARAASVSMTRMLVPAAAVGILTILDVCYLNPPVEGSD